MRRADNQGSIALIVAETITSGWVKVRSRALDRQEFNPTLHIALHRANRRFVPTNMCVSADLASLLLLHQLLQRVGQMYDGVRFVKEPCAYRKVIASYSEPTGGGDNVDRWPTGAD
jgi:hypothetical protein